MRSQAAARATAIALALLVGCTNGAGPVPARSNVLLITIDTLRADHVGSYGYGKQTTPRLDRLAAQGIRFTEAVSVSSWTLPAHASLMTGLYPAEHGVETDLNALPGSADTLAERFAAGGYATFAAISHVYLGARWGFAQGFDAVDDRVANGSPHRPVAEHIADSVIAFLDANVAKQGRAEQGVAKQAHAQQRSTSGSAAEADRPLPPFFVWAHIFDPHWDYSPPAPMNTVFDPGYTGSMDGKYGSLAPYIRATAKGDPPALPTRDLEHLLALYDGEIAYVDTHVGRILDALQRTGLYDETIIVVTSDHGEEFMEHGSLEGHQWTLYDEVVMVPLIVRLPGARAAGGVVSEQVSTVGVPGMILDLAGLPPFGRSLAPLLAAHGVAAGRGDKTSLPAALLDLTISRKHRTTGLRTPGGKLLRPPTGEQVLYADPAPGNEQEDSAAKTPKLRDRLSGLLDETLAGLQRLEDAGATRGSLDETTREKLRALGYAQ